MSDDERGDNVISLPARRARVDVGRGRTTARRLEALLDQANPEAAVRALPVDELHDLVQEGGLAGSVELLARASPEQVRALMDLGIWSGDQLEPRRLDEWVAVMAE